jgi:hypothetical protein
MKKLIGLILLLGAFISPSFSQVEKELNNVDTLYFCTCTGENFQFIDLYTKTRWEKTDLTYNREDGTGFYEYFFTTGDFDIKRMPCSFKNAKGVVTAIQVITEDGKDPRTVMFITLEENVTVAWVEAEKAFESGEMQYR